MDTLLTVLIGIIVLSVLVFIHEGGHYLAARAFGVRVTEFMLGLPGPKISFTKGETAFGVTAVPLGGYAKVCGMEAGPMSPHLKAALASMRVRKTANMEDVALDAGITDDEAYAALEELTEWGTLSGPTRKDPYNTYRLRIQPAENVSTEDLLQQELARQYRSLPFWKRSVILVAGPATNILFALLAFILCYSVFGFDMPLEDGTTTHVTLTIDQSLKVVGIYLGMVVQAAAQLLNPATTAQVIGDSASVVGVAVVSKQAFDMGLVTLFEFTAMISVSLGIMNMLPIPPLDGGRFLVEVIQKITGKTLSVKVMNIISMVGIMLFVGLFLVLVGQDIGRIATGEW